MHQAGKRRRKGFTLIELLVVVSVITVLAAIVYANVQESRRITRDNIRRTDLVRIGKALEEHIVREGQFPDIGGERVVHSGQQPEWSNFLSGAFAGGEPPVDPRDGEPVPGLHGLPGFPGEPVAAVKEAQGEFHYTYVRRHVFIPGVGSPSPAQKIDPVILYARLEKEPEPSHPVCEGFPMYTYSYSCLDMQKGCMIPGAVGRLGDRPWICILVGFGPGAP